MTSRPAARILALLALPCILACADDRALLIALPDGIGTGGAPATGGASATGGATGGQPGSGAAQGTGGVATGAVSGSGGSSPTSCAGGFATCDGNLTGTWTVTSSCLPVPPSVDLSLIGLSCSKVAATGTVSAAGNLRFDGSGFYADDTRTMGTETLTLPAACMNFSGTRITCPTVAPLLTLVGYASADCKNRPDGGCDCAAVVNQRGSLGYVGPNLSSLRGSYAASFAKVVFDGQRPYPFCASADKLILMTPASLVGPGLVALARTAP